MCKIFFTVVFFSIFINCAAQDKGNDSLQKAMSAAPPLQRFDMIRKQMEYENFSAGGNIDSSLCIQLLNIAQQLKSDSLMAISYDWIGSYFAFTRIDNVAALEYFFKGIPFAEKANDKRRLSSLYFDISYVYANMQNYAAVLDNIIKGGQNLPDRSSSMYDFMLAQYQRSLTAYYLYINNADSAIYYVKLTEATANRTGVTNFIYSVAFLKAASYALAKNTAMADSAFKKAIDVLPAVQLNALRITFYTSYIQFLLNVSRIDQAKKFAHQFLDLSEQYQSNTMKLQAAGFLRQVYDSLHQTDSAYYYSRLETKINADIYSEGNINRMQALSFREKLRSIEADAQETAYKNQLKLYALAAGLVFFVFIGVLLYRNNLQRKKANTVLEKTLTDLKNTQSQLVQSEKMASLGELTAGIAHEIQNPLNFVNNFSEVNKELLTEMNEEIEKGNYNEVKAIAKDVTDNEEKINHHGKRADAIVKGMLQHSRTTNSTKEPTDINKLADEYLRLAYHGLRAKDKSFNATLKTDFDETIGNINIIPQDIGRVLLNLITNAFYVVDEKKKASTSSAGQSAYEPTVSVSTKKINNNVEIKVADNGNGIPKNILDKIFQPFFTTKPTGQGTGLGLSLAYDIVKSHGGELKVETKEAEGTEFIVELPIKNA